MEAAAQPDGMQAAAAAAEERQATPAPGAAFDGHDRHSPSAADGHSSELAPVQEEDEDDDGAEDADDGDAAAPEAAAAEAAAAEEAPAGTAAAATKPLSVKNSCRVEGCTRSLLKEKNYFRRYRCCKEHSRSPMVVINGEQKRFCQQCCSFHPLEAFDGDRRNCRERLAMHNDRRRKRSQANTAAAAGGANSRPVRASAGAAAGAHRAAAGVSSSSAMLPLDSPPAALPSVRTASGFALARPPTGVLAGYGAGAFGRAYPGYGCGVVPAAPGGFGGFSAADLETARRASEPPANLGRAAAGFLSEASALLGRPSSRAAAMYGSGYGVRPTGSTFSPPLHTGSLASPSYGSVGIGGAGIGIPGIGSQPSPFEASHNGNGMGGGQSMLGSNGLVSANGIGGGNGLTPGMYDEASDSMQSIRTPSGRVLNLKRRGSVNDRMRNLDIHGHQSIDLDDRPDSIKRASFGLDNSEGSVQRPSFGLDSGSSSMQRPSFGLDNSGGVHRPSFGVDISSGGMQRPSFGTEAGPASVYRASFGADTYFGSGVQRVDGSLGSVQRPSFGDGSIQRPSFGADAGFGTIQRPSLRADGSMKRASFGADGGVQRTSFGGPQYGGGADPASLHRPSFEAPNVHRASFGQDASVWQPSGGSSYTGAGYGAFSDLSCMPNLAALRQAATAAEAGGGGSPGGSSLRGHSGGDTDLRAPSAELRAGSGGPSSELRTASAAGSEIASGFSGGYIGGGGLGGGGGGANASLYPSGSMRSASGRLLPAGDGGAGVQVSGGFGGFGSAAIAGSDAAKQLPMGPPGGRGGAGGSSGGVSSAPGWGDDGSGGVRSMARLSATQLDSLRRDAGLPSVKSLSSDQQVPVYLGRQASLGLRAPNPFQGGRAAFGDLMSHAQQRHRQPADAWQRSQSAAAASDPPGGRMGLQQPAPAWGAIERGGGGAARQNLPLAATVAPVAAATLLPLRTPQQQPQHSAPARASVPEAQAPWAKEPGSPVLAGDPRLIDELMQEMIGGSAWPAEQGQPASAAGAAPPVL